MKSESGVTIVAMIVIFIAAMIIAGIIGNLLLGENNSYIKEYVLEKYTQAKNFINEKILGLKVKQTETNNQQQEVVKNTIKPLNEYIEGGNVQSSSWY